MTIELSKAPQENNAVTGAAQRCGKQKGKPDALANDAGGGFSALMNMLTDANTENNGSDILLQPPDSNSLGNAVDASMVPGQPWAGSAGAEQMAVLLSGSEAKLTMQAVGDAGSLDGVMANGMGKASKGSLPGDAKGKVGLFTQDANQKVFSGIGLTDSDEKTSTMKMLSEQFASDQQHVSSGLSSAGHKNTSQLQSLTAVQSELRENKLPAAMAAMTTGNDVAGALVLSGASDILVRSHERTASKSANGMPGSGVDGAFGQSFATSNGRTDSSFEVTAPSAMVPEGAVAETVSYWVTQGIQSAELKLDGFGGDPVEVSISLNGDQAQIEFRTDQADVRLALEGATSHLKEVLSMEGLNLTGVSVGSSGRDGSQRNEQRQATPPRQASFVRIETVAQTTSRVTTSSVGRSLDVFA